MATEKKSFKVDTSPTKEAVVDSLTRDVTVETCIFDLIDNAVDAARDTIFRERYEEAKVGLPESYEGFKIELTLDGDGLKITDNCGGIALDRLQSMVLRFGKTSEKQMGIGVFGVGLNRALFKLGRISHLKTDTGTQRAELVLNTEEYIKRAEDWSLPAEEFASTGEIGTVIEIRQSPEDISQKFADAEWHDNFRYEIGKRYGRFIVKKLIIIINDHEINNGEVKIRDGGPYDSEYKFYKTEDGVSIHIEHGQHDGHRFSKEDGYDINNNKKLTDQYGWTILCNDRSILISDRSKRTGWDSFHTEFYGFVGKVNFVCRDPGKLPWDTTKTAIDLHNHAYITALQDMRRFVQKWRTFAEARKKKEGIPKPVPPKSPPSIPTPPKPSSPLTIPKPTVKPFVKVDHIQSRTVLPDDVDERHCNDKHLRLVHEAKRLDLADFTYSGLALVRMLFESSVVTYMARHNRYDELKGFAIAKRVADRGKPLTKDEENKLVPSLDEMVAFLENRPDVWGEAKQNHLKHSLKNFGKHKPTLNAAIHNPFQPVAAAKAFEIREEVLPMLRHLIET